MSNWEHAAIIVGSVLAVAVGFADANWHQTLSFAFDSLLIIAGLTTLGVKGVGGFPK